MKYKIALQLFLGFGLLFIGFSDVQASEITGTLSSSRGEVSHDNGSTGSSSPSINSSESSEGVSSDGIIMSGTVTGGISSSGESVSDSQNFITSDGMAFDPSSSHLAFSEFGTNTGSYNPSVDDFRNEMPNTLAQVIASSLSMSTWAWIALLGLASLTTAFVYQYVRNRTSKALSTGHAI